jgi:hypothetical protein
MLSPFITILVTVDGTYPITPLYEPIVPQYLIYKLVIELVFAMAPKTPAYPPATMYTLIKEQFVRIET